MVEMGNTDQCERTGGGDNKSNDKITRDEIKKKDIGPMTTR